MSELSSEGTPILFGNMYAQIKFALNWIPNYTVPALAPQPSHNQTAKTMHFEWRYDGTLLTEMHSNRNHFRFRRNFDLWALTHLLRISPYKRGANSQSCGTIGKSHNTMQNGIILPIQQRSRIYQARWRNNTKCHYSLITLQNHPWATRNLWIRNLIRNGSHSTDWMVRSHPKSPKYLNLGVIKFT